MHGLTVNSHETLLSCHRPVILDQHSGSGCFPLFIRNTASVLAPKLSRLFRRLLCCGEFPLEWRIADVIPNSQRSLIGACLQLSADFDYTSSVKIFRSIDLFEFWPIFGDI